MPTLNTVIKQASRGADLYFVFRFLRLLTMKYEKTAAYKLGIIDKKGKPLKRSSELESVDEKAAYTMLHRLVFKIRRLIEKVPIIGKSILLNYAAALFLLTADLICALVILLALLAGTHLGYPLLLFLFGLFYQVIILYFLFLIFHIYQIL